MQCIFFLYGGSWQCPRVSIDKSPVATDYISLVSLRLMASCTSEDRCSTPGNYSSESVTLVHGSSKLACPALSLTVNSRGHFSRGQVCSMALPIYSSIEFALHGKYVNFAVMERWFAHFDCSLGTHA